METNKLINETSPYLLQHAHNPVDWFAWGDEALQKAKVEDKPILVSIGYSACHWCHVMERECFENEQIAAIMNKYFVCIKIDREERPDIDAIYMEALQTMGLRGGWPLNVFLMPDAKPFYGGTYFPPKNWANLLLSIHDTFSKNRIALHESAEGFAKNLNQKESDKYQLSIDETQFLPKDIAFMFDNLYQNFDFERGGMNRSPKFPMPSIWKFLLTYYAISKDEKALTQLKLTLDRIALGGIYDQIGGGWARYSTDNEWFCPHFEKMLYDNGQLLSVYSSMYQLTKNELYQERVYQTVKWLEREMMHSSGGFYSALDADSEGEEGKFYVWTKHEIESVLGDDAECFCKLFNISEVGNWEEEKNIIHQEARTEFEGQNLKLWFEKLFTLREKRIRPSLDDKVLCSWNGLIIKGLADAFRVFRNELFLDLALKNAEFIYQKMSVNAETEEGRIGRGLWHSFAPNKAESPKNIGFLEDYAAVIEGYISLYQATFDEKWLNEAKLLTEYTIANFYDTEEGFFYFTDIAAESLIARKKELFDNVIPASNSMMAENLFWLGKILERTDFQAIVEGMLSKMKKLITNQTEWLSNWANLAVLQTRPIVEVAIVGNDALRIREALEKNYQPNRIFVGTRIESNLALLENRTATNGQTTIFVCINKTCNLPTQNIDLAKKMMLEA